MDDSLIFSKLYNYFLEIEKNRRNKAIELLKDRNFDKLKAYTHYTIKIKNIIQLENTNILDVIKELQYINSTKKDNETDKDIIIIIDYNESESKICISSYFYEIENIHKCESLAKNMAKHAIFKIKHQPNGKDTIGYNKILENL